MDLSRNNGDGAPRGGDPLASLLRECESLGASDLHLRTDQPPFFRVEGPLKRDAERAPMSADAIRVIADALIGSADRAPLENTGSIDGAISSESGARFRFNVFRREGTLSIALRRLEDRFRTLQELGLSGELYRLCGLADGLVLLAGATGSGKSTTLAALLDRINQTRPVHIITIEDPIEYIHKPATALVNQRQIGTDARDFNEALIASLRQDPDVILVGEIREIHTIRTAITAAETGHLVFTTVHAGDCVGSIERLVSVFPAEEQTGVRRQLSMVLRAVIAQRLMIADGENARAAAGEGHVARRVLASEILMINAAVANLIATGKSTQIYSSMESGGAAGMQTMEQDLARLLGAGLISERAAVAAARSPEVMFQRLGANGPRARPAMRGGAR